MHVERSERVGERFLTKGIRDRVGVVVGSNGTRDKRTLQVVLISHPVPLLCRAFSNPRAWLTTTQAFEARDLPHRLDNVCGNSPRWTKHAKHVARTSARSDAMGKLDLMTHDLGGDERLRAMHLRILRLKPTSKVL